MSMISVYDLMTICRVLLLIIGQNDINPKLLQPIVASICKVMTVKKPCVRLFLPIWFSSHRQCNSMHSLTNGQGIVNVGQDFGQNAFGICPACA